jgi:hypothetical protein
MFSVSEGKQRAERDEQQFISNIRDQVDPSYHKTFDLQVQLDASPAGKALTKIKLNIERHAGKGAGNLIHDFKHSGVPHTKFLPILPKERLTNLSIALDKLFAGKSWTQQIIDEHIVLALGYKENETHQKVMNRASQEMQAEIQKNMEALEALYDTEFKKKLMEIHRELEEEVWLRQMAEQRAEEEVRLRQEETRLRQEAEKAVQALRSQLAAAELSVSSPIVLSPLGKRPVDDPTREQLAKHPKGPISKKP